MKILRICRDLLFITHKEVQMLVTFPNLHFDEQAADTDNISPIYEAVHTSVVRISREL